MDGLIYLIPAALFLGLLGLAGFFWSINHNQYDDLEGASYRALFEEDDIAEELEKKEKNSHKET
ncbi:MAG: cbb3-type cytochrome oxidase assembly protein CcoS [Kordiimonadaceae bacterium]|nr:cbb3-type cytochrome oxidase assembly protein CcoS [Kordiimonadaceae bacterium]